MVGLTPINAYGIYRRIPIDGVNTPFDTAHDNAFDPGICDPCGDYPVCEDSLTIVTANEVNSILYLKQDGTTVTLTLDVTGKDNVVAAVQEALEAYELDIYVTGTTSGSNFILKHRGQGAIISADVVTTGTVTATRVCTVVTRCDYQAVAGGTITGIEVDGTLRDFTDIVAGTTSAADAKTRIDAGLTLADLDGGATSTVTYDATDQVFNITISARNAHAFVLQQSTGTTVGAYKTSCEEVFEA
jgi:hypothetical protein